MKLLFVSNLFPNAAKPMRGVFNAQLVAALSKLCEVTVVAPTSQAMSDGNRAGVRVIHPRFFHVPVLSRPFNGCLFARAIEPVIRHELRFGERGQIEGVATVTFLPRSSGPEAARPRRSVALQIIGILRIGGFG